MQEHKEKEKKTKRAKKWNGEKRFYLFTALGCAAALSAIVIVAVAISGGDKGGVNNKVDNTPTIEVPDNTPTNPNENEQVSGLPDGMISPMELVSVTHEYGFYHNETLNSYYEHKGMDFSAEVGAEVLAVEDGKVESVYTGDVLLGTEITIDHGNGVKSVYRFVTEAEGLKAGDMVKKGDVIATVAEASGNEYKQGAHLHFEIMKNDVSVDPSTYLTLEEK